MLLLFFVANVDALCPLTIMHVPKPANYTHEVLLKKKNNTHEGLCLAAQVESISTCIYVC